MTHPHTMPTRLSRRRAVRVIRNTRDRDCSLRLLIPVARSAMPISQTRDGQPHYAASITAFAKGHPEFSALRAGKADPGRVKFNHYVHLQPHLMGPNNLRVELSCDDCHRTTKGNDGWPYASTVDASQVSESVPQGLKPASSVGHGGTAEAVPFPAVPFPIRERYMAPITFSQNCAACHTLQFDKRFGNEQVPHEKPEVVHAFLQKRFGEYIAAHPEAVHEVNPPDRQIPERVRVPRVARNANEWVQFRTEDAEWLLWSKTCKQCHSLSPGAGPLPVVAKSNLTARWLPHAQFDHDAHRMMTCSAAMRIRSTVARPPTCCCPASRLASSAIARADPRKLRRDVVSSAISTTTGRRPNVRKGGLRFPSCVAWPGWTRHDSGPVCGRVLPIL